MLSILAIQGDYSNIRADGYKGAIRFSKQTNAAFAGNCSSRRSLVPSESTITDPRQD